MLCTTGFSLIFSSRAAKAWLSPLRHSAKYRLCSSGVKPNTSIREETTGWRSPDDIERDVTITELSALCWYACLIGEVSLRNIESFWRWDGSSSQPSRTNRMPHPLVAMISLASLVPRPIPSFSMLHAEKRFSACNIEKLGMGLGTRLASDIIATNGCGILFVLDGWDELPSHLQKDSIFRKLTSPMRQAYQQRAESSVIVTSRSISSGDLHPVVSSRIEVLGFTPEEQRRYFAECLKGDSQALAALLEKIKENPVVQSICYLPLNAAFVVHTFKY